jgi:hypothetical protein
VTVVRDINQPSLTARTVAEQDQRTEHKVVGGVHFKKWVSLPALINKTETVSQRIARVIGAARDKVRE